MHVVPNGFTNTVANDDEDTSCLPHVIGRQLFGTGVWFVANGIVARNPANGDKNKRILSVMLNDHLKASIFHECVVSYMHVFGYKQRSIKERT